MIEMKRIPSLYAVLLALLLAPAPALPQTCVKYPDNQGCVPPLHPQQCFPVASGPEFWQDVGGDHTWQYRRAIQSPNEPTCEGTLQNSIPNCCSGIPPSGGPAPTVSVRIVGKRILVDYNAPGFYCTNLGDWPPQYTCTNDPQAAGDRLVLWDPADNPIRYSYIFFENGTWDTGVDIPSCGQTVSYKASIRYLTSAGPFNPVIVYSAVTALTATCNDRRECPGAATGSSAAAATTGLGINVGSGNVTTSQNLFTFAQAPLSMPFTLTYHSSAAMFPALVSEPIGKGWTHEYAQTLRPEDGSNNRLYHITAEGYEHEYLRIAPATTWTAINPGELRGTVQQVGGEYQLTDLNGTVTTFDVPTGRWNSTKDRWGNTISGTYTTGQLTMITDSMGRQVQLAYPAGQVTITLPNSKTWKLTLSGELLTAVRDPLHPSSDWRTYTYVNDHAGVQRLLSSVKDDAGKELEAHTYDNVAGTGTDRGLTSSQAGGTRSNVSITYTGGNTRTVAHTIDATTTQTTTFTLAYLVGRWLPTQISGNCASCGGNDSELRVFTYDYSNHVLSRKDGTAPNDVETKYTYNGSGMPTSTTEAVGKPETRTTSYSYAYVPPVGSSQAPWPAFLTQVTEPSVGNPASSKTTTYSWNSSGTPETTLTTTFAGHLNPTTPANYTTTATFAAPRHRLTSLTGPATNQKITHAYFADAATNDGGRLQTTAVYTSATAHLDTGFASYDLYGTPGTVTDPNSVQTVSTTDDRGRVVTVVSKKPASDQDEPADYTTTYAFDSRDRLSSVTRPESNKVLYEYEDGTNRLLNTIRVDSLNRQQERLRLTLNVIGGKTKEEAQACTSPANPCSAGDWVTKRSDDFAYDTKNRLVAVIHPVGGRIDYTYGDSRGNLTGVKDERHTADSVPNLVYAYDALSRLTSVTQHRPHDPGPPPSVVTSYAYDKHDNLILVTDPKGNQTSGTYDDFRRPQTQASPVAGTTTYSSYDPAGNLLISMDANQATTTRTYDAANRILMATSARSGLPTETVTYTYDGADPPDEQNPPNPPKPHPKRYARGRLATMTDPSGSSQYSYERRGLLKKEWKTIDLDTYGLQYGYDKNGNRNKIRYPSGRLVSYAFDFADRPLSADSSGATYVSSALYQPFGPEFQITYGNGTRATMTFDQRYRLTVNKLEKLSPLSTIAQSTYILDGVGNITSIADNDPTYSRTTLAYDDLSRLKTATSGMNLWVTGSYTYDDLGSVTGLTMGSRTATFTYAGTTPKLMTVDDSEIGSRTVTYDASGNEIGVTGVAPGTFTYSPRNYLSAADNLTYTYDGQGLRVATALSSTVFPISLRIDPSSVVGGPGGSAIGTITLNAGAPSGTSVSLKASDAIVSFPVNPVPITQGQTSATFSITTSPVASDTKVVVSASYANVTKTEVLAVTSIPRLLTVSVSPRTVQGGSPSTGTVVLNGPASGTATVTLSSSNTAVATVPASVPVPNSLTTANFAITTFGVMASQAVTITATYPPSPPTTRWVSLTVMQLLAQGEGPQEPGLEEKLPAFHLASLSLGAGSVLHSVRGGDFELFGDERLSLGLPDFAASESGGVRPMDGPIYSVPGPAKRNYIYSPELNLLAESEVSSPRDRQILYEYIWFNGHPVAQIDGSTVSHWTFTDHLGTPTIQTDAAGIVFWRVEYEPYGKVFAKRPTGLADQHQPLRLPGQEAEQFNLGTNGLTERFYNAFRWYRPNWGRYTQPDPLKQRGEAHPYGYASGNPLGVIDPFGLLTISRCGNAAAAIHRAVRQAAQQSRACFTCGNQWPRLRDELVNMEITCAPDAEVRGACADYNRATHQTRLNLRVATGLLGPPGCPCLPALLAHEAAHAGFDPPSAPPDYEGMAERIERCFGSCSTPPTPGDRMALP